MGCWGVASDENDHTWDEMPICGKKGAEDDDPLGENIGENRLVNYKATKHSRYGGVWTRNLATSDIEQFMSDVNEISFEEGSVPDTFKWPRTSLGCVIFLLKVGCRVPRKFLMTAQHVLQDENVAETYPENINERKKIICTELDMISRALSNGGKLPGDPIGVRGLFVGMSPTERKKHGFTTQLDDIEILNDDLSKLHDSLKLISPDSTLFNDMYELYTNRSEKLRLMLSKSKSMMLNDGDYPQMRDVREVDRNMIKHAATSLKTALTFEPEQPEDALTNASVYALKIFDMLIAQTVENPLPLNFDEELQPDKSKLNKNEDGHYKRPREVPPLNHQWDSECGEWTPLAKKKKGAEDATA